jgi:hypothetical protein
MTPGRYAGGRTLIAASSGHTLPTNYLAKKSETLPMTPTCRAQPHRPAQLADGPRRRSPSMGRALARPRMVPRIPLTLAEPDSLGSMRNKLDGAIPSQCPPRVASSTRSMQILLVLER